MTDSTARAERFEPDAPVVPSFTWTVPQKPVAVRIPLTLIEKLERQAVESYRSLTSKGSEIGGLLFGSVTPGNPALVEIESYEAVPCDYASGPLYHLSDAELSRLDRTLEERRKAGMRPVGFFRSQTRKGLSLDASDLGLLDSRFPGAQDIALVVRPSATKASVAGIFIREEGKIRSDASYLEFPFRSSSQEKDAAASEGAVAGPRNVAAAPAAPMAPKPAVRAQIVPIASRREVMPVTMEVSGTTGTEAAAEAPVAEPPASTPQTVAKVAQPEKPAAAEPVKESAAAPKPAVKEAPAKGPAPASKPVVKEAAAKAPEPKPAINEPAATAPEAPAKPVVREPAPKEAALAPKPAVKEETSAEGEEVPAAKGSSKLMWIVLGVAASVVLIGGLLFTSGMLRLRNHTLPANTTETGLALRIERNAGDILLTWNRDAEVIKHASRAVLAINDGPQHENVEMDLSQLRTGSIVYSPVTSDVVFQMEVTAAGQRQPVSETVRVLRTRPSPMPSEQTAAPAETQAGTKAGAPPSPSAAPPAPSAEEAAAEQPKEEKVALAQAVKPFHAESLAQRLRATRPEEVADAPSPVGAAPVAGVAVNLGGIVGNTVAPPPAAPKSAAPAGASPSIPPADRKTVAGGQIQQAELLHRRDPEYPKLARESGASGIVELTATVGADGHVKAVKVVRGHPLLRQAAVDAVKQWIYRPTMLNGSPVETQTQVLLNFKSDR
jgi:protein TonB